MSKNAELQAEALQRAKYGNALTNYPAIFQGFIDKGIPEDQIMPRENVFTYNAWKAQGRQVKRGEHGVRVVTWVERERENKDGKAETVRFPKTTTVFHISQTDSL